MENIVYPSKLTSQSMDKCCPTLRATTTDGMECTGSPQLIVWIFHDSQVHK